MPVQKPSRVDQFVAAAREWLPTIGPRLHEWWEQVREEPEIVWRSPIFRCLVIFVVGCVLLAVASFASSLITPPTPVNVRPLAQTANFEVLCSNPACGRRFMINREFDFDGFPTPCPKCKQRTGQRAVHCYAPTCQGKTVAPTRRDDGLYCPRCNGRLRTSDD